MSFITRKAQELSRLFLRIIKTSALKWRSDVLPFLFLRVLLGIQRMKEFCQKETVQTSCVNVFIIVLVWKFKVLV